MADAPVRAIIDTDPGIDDAIAILFALGSMRRAGEPGIEVLGLTTVAGNLGIETTTRNAGRLLALAGRPDIPVVAGASAPLARKGFDTADIHGSDGLGGVGLPEPKASPLAGAVGWIAGVLEREPEGTVDLLALGPMTNVALLLREHPEAARRLRRLIAMGGAIDEPGNVGARAEFNIAADPEAAEIVLSAGLPTTLVPLDVTRRVRVTRAWTGALRAAGGRVAPVAADIVEAYFRATGSGESRPLHDPCVALLALRPDLFDYRAMVLDVDTGHGPDAGALDVAQHGAPVSVAMAIRAEPALDLLRGGLLAAG